MRSPLFRSTLTIVPQLLSIPGQFLAIFVPPARSSGAPLRASLLKGISKMTRYFCLMTTLPRFRHFLGPYLLDSRYNLNK